MAKWFFSVLAYRGLEKQKEITMNEQLRKRLDEAADNYAEKHGFRVPYNGSNNFYDETDVKASKDGFLAGAELGYKEAIEMAKEWLLGKICIEIDAQMAYMSACKWKDEKFKEYLEKKQSELDGTRNKSNHELLEEIINELFRGIEK